MRHLQRCSCSAAQLSAYWYIIFISHPGWDPACAYDMCANLVINAPRVFGAIWKIISLVLNERTKAKIQVSTGDFDGELAKLVGGEERLQQILAAVQPAGANA